MWPNVLIQTGRNNEGKDHSSAGINLCSVRAAHRAVSVRLQSLQALEAEVVFMLGWYLIELTWTKLPASAYDRFIHVSSQSEK